MLIAIVIIAVCVVVGLMLYQRAGPSPYRDSDDFTRKRLDRSLERHQTIERAEAKFQEERRLP